MNDRSDTNDSFEDALPPADISTTFYDTFQDFTTLTWAVFCCLTTSERQDLYAAARVGMGVTQDLELALTNDSRRHRDDRFTRTNYSTRIKNIMSKVDANKGGGETGGDEELQGQPRNPLSSLDGDEKYGGASSSNAPLVRIADNFVGIRNQSSTCYLNALIQSLFHLPCFRQLIYQIPVTAETQPTESIPLALQLLFFSLQQRRATARTVNLTTAFGWDSAQSAIQHDIHELTRKLLDVLESETAGSSLAESIPKMFRGKMLYYTKCLDVDYISRREEFMYDVEVVVRGNPTLEASLTTLVKPERMDGDNKYCWEHDGEIDPKTGKTRKTYHDADRGVAFQQLPPVMMVHPNRLEFDMNTLQRVTVGDRWEFPQEIDMSPFVADDTGFVRGAATAEEVAAANADAVAEDAAAAANGGMGRQQSSRIIEDYRYVLRSVIVHSGYATAGHYYCYTNFDGMWVKFNDDLVTDVTYEQVVRDAVGGDITTINYWNEKVSRPSTTRASLLVYVRKSMLSEVVFDIREQDVPAHILERSIEEAAKEVQSAGPSRDSHSAHVIEWDAAGEYLSKVRDYTTAPIWTFQPDQPLHEQFNFQDKEIWFMGSWYTYSQSYRSKYKARRVKQGDTARHHLLAGYPDILIILPKPVAAASPETPAAPVADADALTTRTSTTVTDIDEDEADDVPFLLHVLTPNPSNGEIEYRGVIRSRRELKEDYIPKRSPFGLVTDYKKSVTKTDMRGLFSGDIVIVVDESVEPTEAVARRYALKHYSMQVECFNLLEPADPVITLNMIDDMEYPDIQDMIHEALGHPEGFTARQIGLRNHNLSADTPGRHMLLAQRGEGRNKTSVTLNMLLAYRASITVNKLHYEILPQGLTAIEIGNKGYHDFTLYDGNKPKHFYWAPAPYNNVWLTQEQINDMLQTASNALEIPINRIRLFTFTYDGKLDNSSLHDDPHLKVAWRESDVNFDVIPEDVAVDPHPEIPSMVLDVQHACRRNGEDYFHSPTVIRLRPDDTGSDIIRRVARHMTLSDADSKTWKLYFRPSDTVSGQPIPIDLESKPWELIVSKTLTQRRYLLIDHPTMSVVPIIRNEKAGANFKWVRQAEPELRIQTRARPTATTTAPAPTE